jgi:glutamyl-tRNA synthetase
LDAFVPTDFKTVEGHLLNLDSVLTLRSFIVGYSLSAPDVALWGAIQGNRVASANIRKGSIVNCNRWFKFVEELCPWIKVAIDGMNAAAKEKKLAKAREGASYDIDLQNTGKGVVTRFPPEPS